MAQGSPIQMSQTQNSQNQGTLIVAAIDFGTTFSGYAFQFRHEFEESPMKITTNSSWVASGQGLASWKAPTSVLFDPDGEFDSFGYEAEEKYVDLAEEDMHRPWYYFHRFKMLLHGQQGFQRNISIEDAMGKTMSAKKVFAAAIKYLKDHLMDMLKRRLPDINCRDILWVLTIPAIWNEPAKQFMRESAIEAGIESSQLKLALEPEAASLYCKMAPTERLNSTESLGMRTFDPLTRYMVLDIGGGTVDVTVHQVLQDGTLKELHKASGGAWGGTKVDMSYFQVFKNIFGEKTMKTFSHDYKIDHLDLTRDFELKKRSVKTRDAKMNIRVSVSLKDAVKKEFGKKPDEVVKESSFEGRIKFTRDRMSFDGTVVEDMFKEAISSIINHVQDIISLEKMQGLNLILMVGGFSESPLLLNALREAFPDFTIIAPDDPGLAVVKGAVLFGQLPNAISSRISRYTVGIATMGDFNHQIHPMNKKVIMATGGVLQCKDLFSKFVGAGDDLRFDHKKEKVYIISDSDSKVVLEIFISPDEYPMFTTDPNCSKLGQILVDVPKGGWARDTEMKIEMGFGGAEFTVTASDTHTKKEYNAKFDFLQ